MFCKTSWPTACGSASSEFIHQTYRLFISTRIVSYPASLHTAIEPMTTNLSSAIFARTFRKFTGRIMKRNVSFTPIWRMPWYVLRGPVFLPFPLTYHDQDIKATRSIIANGRFYGVIFIVAAMIYWPQFAIPYSGTTWNLLPSCKNNHSLGLVGILLHYLVLRASRDGLKDLLHSYAEVNGTDLYQHIPVPIMIRFGCCHHVFIVDSYYCLS